MPVLARWFADRALRSSYWAVFGLLVACSGTDGEADDTTDAAGDETMDSGADTGQGEFVNAPCDSAVRAGGFTIQLEDGYTQVEGQVFDAANPAPKVELDADGDCRLLVTENHFCDPACGATEVCTADLACVAKPVAVEVGNVSVSGLSAAVTMEPNVTNFYLNLDELPHPGFMAGTEVSLQAAGGAGADGFSLRGVGSEPFEVSGGDITVVRDEPVSLGWAAPADPDITTVHLDLDIGHHGGSPATIECDTADTGSFEIPATLVNQLIDYGVAGFPELRVTRQTIDSADVGGRCFELMVAPSSASLAVVIDGLDSCSTSADCPDGQTCQSDLTCG